LSPFFAPIACIVKNIKKSKRLRKRLLSTKIDRKSGRGRYFGAAQSKIKDARRQMKIPHPGEATSLRPASEPISVIERSLTLKAMLAAVIY
jgi:hypothetical protein